MHRCLNTSHSNMPAIMKTRTMPINIAAPASGDEQQVVPVVARPAPLFGGRLKTRTMPINIAAPASGDEQQVVPVVARPAPIFGGRLQAHVPSFQPATRWDCQPARQMPPPPSTRPTLHTLCVAAHKMADVTADPPHPSACTTIKTHQEVCHQSRTPCTCLHQGSLLPKNTHPPRRAYRTSSTPTRRPTQCPQPSIPTHSSKPPPEHMSQGSAEGKFTHSHDEELHTKQTPWYMSAAGLPAPCQHISISFNPQPHPQPPGTWAILSAPPSNIPPPPCNGPFDSWMGSQQVG